VNGARAAFQVALDSAALMMSKDAPTKTDAERQAEAAKTFSALFNRPEVTDATVTPVFHRGRRVETDLGARRHRTDVIILLTDGLNTQNRWSSTQTDTDDRRR
jgi:hypothetical protein